MFQIKTSLELPTWLVFLRSHVSLESGTKRFLLGCGNLSLADTF